MFAKYLERIKHLYINYPLYANITYNSFPIIQHNIGGINVMFSTTVYNGSGYKESTNIVSHKQNPSNRRSVQNYIEKNNNKFGFASLYTLQEVQEDSDGVFSFSTNSIQYTVIYKKTGHIWYCNEDESNPRKIDHGCCVVFDENIFTFSTIENPLDSQTHTDSELNSRSSGWVFLYDKISGRQIAIISLHGKIPSPITGSNVTRVITIYTELSRDIGILKESGYEVIIGTDLNMNITIPNFNPFNTEIINDSYYESAKEIIDKLHLFIDMLIKKNIKTYVNNDYTSVSFGYQDTIDYIFSSLDYELFTRVQASPFFKNTVYNLHGLTFLENDFDHTVYKIHLLKR